MNKKMLMIIAGLAFLASLVMYVVGKGSSHLSELYDFFWTPLPLGVVALIVGMNKK